MTSASRPPSCLRCPLGTLAPLPGHQPQLLLPATRHRCRSHHYRSRRCRRSRFGWRPPLLLLPAPLLLRARLPLEPHVGAAPWSDKEAALAPRRKLAEWKFSSHRGVSASSCSPGGTALREGTAPSLPEGPSVYVVGVRSPTRRQAPTRRHADGSFGARARLLYYSKYIVYICAG